MPLQEALEVATQCLAGLLPAEYERPKQPLVHIFTAGLEALEAAADKADAEEKADERFPIWVAKLAEKGSELVPKSGSFPSLNCICIATSMALTKVVMSILFDCRKPGRNGRRSASRHRWQSIRPQQRTVRR